jgi:hypothetical protein
VAFASSGRVEVFLKLSVNLIDIRSKQVSKSRINIHTKTDFELVKPIIFLKIHFNIIISFTLHVLYISSFLI